MLNLSHWKEVFQRLPNRLQKHHALIISGGVAFYFFLSVFPALAAIVSMYGLLTDPSELQEHMSGAVAVLPGEAQGMIEERLSRLAEKTGSILEWQLLFSILISIWITNVGTRALFRGVNIVYGVEKHRKFLEEIRITILFTVGSLLFYLIALVVMIATPALAESLSLPQILYDFLAWLKWPLLAVILVIALSLVYRIAPIDRKLSFRKTLWGSSIATLLWIGGSWGLSVGVRAIGVAPSYGPLAAVAILMLWFLMTSFVILLGAEINRGLEDEMDSGSAKSTSPANGS